MDARSLTGPMTVMNKSESTGLLRGLLVASALAAVAAVAATVMLAHDAEATHFRSGTLYAVPTGGNTVSVQGRIAFRASYPNIEGPPYPQPASFGCAPGVIAPGGFSVALVRRNFNGANPVSVGTASLKVLVCNANDDWFMGQLVNGAGNVGIPVTLPAPLDPTGQPWRISWDSNARITFNVAPNFHMNNGGASWQLDTTVDLSGTADNPPRPFVNPVVQCPIAGICTIPIPYVDDDVGQAHTIRWATGVEATGSTFYQPGPCPNCGGALAATLGPGPNPGELQIMWDTTGAALGSGSGAQVCQATYSAQVMIEDGREKVPMDFLIHLCGGISPDWVSGVYGGQMNPTACDTSPEIVQGGVLNFSVFADSVDSTVALQIIPLETPVGSVMTGGTFGNPGAVGGTASLAFSLNTASLSPGTHLAVFFAQDDRGLTGRSCLVWIHVLPPPTLDFTWTFTTTSPQDLTLDEVQFTETSNYPVALGAGARSWLWTFSDPNDIAAAYQQNPAHRYATGSNAGTPYAACMAVTVTFTGGPWTGSVCHDVVVHNRPPVAIPTPILVMGAQARMYDFGGDPDGTVVSWLWNWGDGTTSNAGRFTNHMYSSDGNYDVCLTTTDNEGSTHTGCVLVHVEIPKSWLDTDLDGVPDAADSCPEVPNNEQADANHDGVGDACQDLPPGIDSTVPRAPVVAGETDVDYDGATDAVDNCPMVPNRDQKDTDGDGLGDFCDFDLDGDSVPQWGPPGSAIDNCPTVANRDQAECPAGAALASHAVVGTARPVGAPEQASEGMQAQLFGQSPTTGFVALTAALLILVVGAVGCTVWAVRRWRQ
ncbi:MAG: thrombospondin type 3 repeat-containing protein [Thermoplasmatota archaeon]